MSDGPLAGERLIAGFAGGWPGLACAPGGEQQNPVSPLSADVGIELPEVLEVDQDQRACRSSRGSGPDRLLELVHQEGRVAEAVHRPANRRFGPVWSQKQTVAFCMSTR